MSMSSEDRQVHRKYLMQRIAENRRRLKEIFGKGGADQPQAPPYGAEIPPAGTPDTEAFEASTPYAAVQAREAPSTFPRSRTMRWAMEHPAEAAVAGVAGAALLGLGPVQLVRWMRSTRPVRAGTSFVHGVREGVGLMQPLLPLFTAWMAHKWRASEKEDTRATRSPKSPPSY